MELVAEISVILILFGIIDTTAATTMKSISLDTTVGTAWLKAWSTKEMTMSTTRKETTSSVTTNKGMVSTEDQKYGINNTEYDKALVSSTKQMPMNTPDTWQTMTLTDSNVTTNQRSETTTSIFISDIQAKSTDSIFLREVTDKESPFSSGTQAQNTEIIFQDEDKGFWKIDWTEIRVGLIFGGATIPLTVVLTLLIIWTRGGSLHSCMRSGGRPKEEETIGLEQLKIARNKSRFSAPDLVIGSATDSTFQSSDDDGWKYDGYLHPIGTEVDNTERISRRCPATNKTVRIGDSDESEYDEPHWNKHEVNEHPVHTGIEADRTEYDTARNMSSTPSSTMSRATDCTVRSVYASESEYDDAHSQHTGAEADNTDYNIPGPTPKPRMSRTTNKNVQSGNCDESEYDQPQWNIHSVHADTEVDNTDNNISRPTPQPRMSRTTNKNVRSGDADENEYDEPHWNRHEVNVHSVHTVIEMENIDYYNRRKFCRNEEEENPYVNE